MFCYSVPRQERGVMAWLGCSSASFGNKVPLLALAPRQASKGLVPRSLPGPSCGKGIATVKPASCPATPNRVGPSLAVSLVDRHYRVVLACDVNNKFSKFWHQGKNDPFLNQASELSQHVWANFPDPHFKTLYSKPLLRITTSTMTVCVSDVLLTFFSLS